MVRDSFNIDYAHHAYSFRPTLCGNCRQWDSKHAEREPVHGRMMLWIHGVEIKEV